MNTLRWVAAFAVATAVSGTGEVGAERGADLIIVGAPVYTMDVDVARAEAVAVSEGEIVAVGRTDDVMRMRRESTRVIELEDGQSVLPGFTDAHGHLNSLGRSLSIVRLMGTSSKAQCLERVRERQSVTPAGQWIRGRGWDQNDWDVKEFPSWRDLDGTDANPLYLRRVDGHAAWLNRAALAAAGITRDTPDPPGGRILRDDDGEPTGVVIDNAEDLVTKHIPDPSAEMLRARLVAASEHCNRLGLVGVHDAGTTVEVLREMRALGEAGDLTLRVYCMLDGTDQAVLDEYLDPGPATFAHGRVVVRSLKLYADGALGSRGAALLEPYSDDPDNSGLEVRTPAELAGLARRALATGFQVCTHAIGDRGNRTTLDVYESVLGARPEGDHRFRIEHAQIVSDGDFARFRRLGVIPCVQPTHATSDMYWAEDRVGPKRIIGAYAWRRFVDEGNALPLGSDFPVEDASPLWGIYAAVTRSDHEGWPDGGWYPDQRLSMEEAVAGFTSAAAYAGFCEDTRGTLSVGKQADIVVLDHDLFEIEPSEILSTRVLYTIVDGDVVYESSTTD